MKFATKDICIIYIKEISAKMAQFVPHSHKPYGKPGAGLYSDCIPPCYQVTAEATPYVMDALDKIVFEKSKNRPFTIADYGVADGGVTMSLMTSIIEKVREVYSEKQEIQILYEDQATNDFASLFRRLYDEKSYLKIYQDVYANACGTNFYSQCFPSGSIDLGFSATAMHWLFKRPCNLKTTLHHSLSNDELEKKLFFEEAKRSWEIILLHRAKELVAGGHMITCHLGVDDKGQCSGHTQRVKANMHEEMANIWRSMLDERIITEDEFVETTFNGYNRTEEEIVTPLKDKTSPVFEAGLRLVAVKTVIKTCPVNLEWLNSGKTIDDIKACKDYAKKYVLMMRIWSNSTFFSGLSDERTTEEKNKIVDKFYQRYENEVIKNPAEHAQDNIHVYVHFKKL